MPEFLYSLCFFPQREGSVVYTSNSDLSPGPFHPQLLCSTLGCSVRSSLFNIPEENIFSVDFFSHCKLFFRGLLLYLVALRCLSEAHA
jgi:hypothetical protein